MNTEFFIAQKIIKKDTAKNAVSKPIVKISLASIAIGVAVMLITVSIVTGFQEKIREKVIGFGSHIQITNLAVNSSMESTPIHKNQPFLKELIKNPSIKKIQNFAYKPAILQTDYDTTVFHLKNNDTSIINRSVLGVLFKGIDKSYDMSFFNNKIIIGKALGRDTKKNEILISEYIAKLLHYKVGDEINAYFIQKNNPKKRKFIITGIYKTGLEEFDKKIIFCTLATIQNINNWGVNTYITIKDTCINNKFVLEAITFGSTNSYLYNWGDGDQKSKYKLINLNTKKINLTVTPIEYDIYGYIANSDSLKALASVNINVTTPCDCNEETFQNTPLEYLSDSLIKTPFGNIILHSNKGTSDNYIGGYEIIINNWDDLNKIDDIIYNEIPFELQSQKITELNPEIFAWLDFLDMNILIILVLMIIVSLINMTTSLLVLILEKTNMIGIFKAIGATNWSIRKIFLYNSLYLLIKGLFWGNLIGLSLLLIQKTTEIIPLDSRIYYLSTVPVSINFSHIILINLLTIVTCMLILIIPSYLVSKINPIKAIKFN